jgi:NAD(P)-dependent dehydrogenase (short-subunit alcohol dehydrogenase family)
MPDTESSRLDNKIVAITGGASGIGAACVALFAERGATVCILDYNREDGAATVDRTIAAGGKASFLQLDVRSNEEVAAAFAQIESQHGRIDVLICCAGVIKGAYRGINELAEEDWDATLDTNLKGTYLTTKHAAPLLIKGVDAVLLLISSGAGVRGRSSSYAYAASKAGMHGMHFNLEAELGPHGVRVHVICPGSIATPLKLANIGQAAAEQGKDAAAAMEEAKKDLGDPMGVARVLCFLASEEGSYVRGTVSTR